jgi:hypothetical protein
VDIILPPLFFSSNPYFVDKGEILISAALALIRLAEGM